MDTILRIKMRKILPLILVLFLTACGSIPNKPITRTLTDEELGKAVQKDSTFARTYEIIQARTILGTLTDPAINKYRALTYKRVHKFVKFAADTAYFNNLLASAEKKWDKKYSRYYNEVDSLSEKWKEHIDSLAPKNYISIEAVGCEREYYSYIHEVKKVFIKFKLTPLDGPISNINFGYAFGKKGEDNSRFSKYDKSWCRETSTITSPSTASWTVNNHVLEQLLKNISFEEFSREYEMFYFVESLNKDGKEISLKELRKEVPPEIRGYWIHEDKPNRDVYVKSIVENILQEPYITKENYLLDARIKELKRKDKLVFNFLKF